MKPGYVPERGDLVWLNFSPQAGHEQRGHRPAIILSPSVYNRHGLALCCPITSRIKGGPFEVTLPEGLAVSGAILSDHVKSQDWRAREIVLKGKAPQSVIDEVLGKVGALLG